MKSNKEGWAADVCLNSDSIQTRLLHKEETLHGGKFDNNISLDSESTTVGINYLAGHANDCI